MRADLESLAHLIMQSFLQPTVAARRITGTDWPRAALWQGLVAVTALSILSLTLMPGPMPDIVLLPTGGPTMTLRPFASAMVLGAMLTITVFTLFYTGQALGGQGDFAGAIAMVAWLELLAIVLRVIGILVQAALGQGAFDVVSVLGFAALIWITVTFLAALHGFDGFGRAILTLVLALIGIGGGLTIIVGAINLLAGGLGDA
jgi:hypothetical protein